METLEIETSCSSAEHSSVPHRETDAKTLMRAAEIFRAAGDLPRLRLLDLLRGGELCVTELAARTGIKLSTLSQQLRILRTEDLIVSRRQGKHIFYSLADRHIADLLDNVLAHAGGDCIDPISPPHYTPRRITMNEHLIHEGHTHQHGADCGHTAIEHDGHVDYLHNGHLHHPHDGHVDEHTLEVSAANPAVCTPDHHCDAHDAQHVHGPNCGHEAVPHDGHVDYLVAGHLHHPHGDHCDNHGNVALVA
jgi:DNA-binding transcriptional ArsR family regulator